MERREAPGCLRGTPGEPCEGPPRAVAIRRAHPSDVGVRRLPALHLRRFRPRPRSPRAGCAAPRSRQTSEVGAVGEANHLFMIRSFRNYIKNGKKVAGQQSGDRDVSSGRFEKLGTAPIPRKPSYFAVHDVIIW